MLVHRKRRNLLLLITFLDGYHWGSKRSAEKINIVFNFILIILSFGDNFKKASRIRPYYKVLWEAFSDPTLRILILAATLTLIIGIFSNNPYSWIEGVSIYFAVAFIAIFASATNYAKEK